MLKLSVQLRVKACFYSVCLRYMYYIFGTLLQLLRNQTAIIMLVASCLVANDAIYETSTPRWRYREKLPIKWCSVKCAELTIGAEERRSLSIQGVSDTFNKSTAAFSGDGKMLHNSKSRGNSTRVG